MGFAEALTIVFVVLKLVGVIDWHWVLVLLPEIIAVGGYIVALVVKQIYLWRIRKFWEDIL